MDQGVKKVRQERWRQIILAACSSGLKKTEWCRQNNVSERQFYYWQRILRQRELVGSALTVDSQVPGYDHTEDNAVLDVCSAVKQTDEFVELTLPVYSKPVTVSPSQISATPLPASDSDTFRPAMVLQVKDHRLFIGNDISEKTLRTVLRVLNA